MIVIDQNFYGSLLCVGHNFWIDGIKLSSECADQVYTGETHVFPFIQHAIGGGAQRPVSTRGSIEMDVESYVSRAHLSLNSVATEENPDLHRAEVPEACDHYKCTLRGRTHEMEFHFSCPTGEGPPRIEDTIRYLGAVAAEYEEFEDITEWADEYGFNARHLDTRDAFDALARLTRDLWRLVGDPLYEELRQGIAIEQAVDMAWNGYEGSQN